MRRQKLDPKHVRWFFYRRSLFVQILTLILDGIWWIIAQGFAKATAGIVRWVQSRLPIRFRVNEKLRRLHTFVVGRTGTGKSVLLHHLIRHYLVRDRKPSIVLLDPHGDLARLVAKDKAHWEHDRLVYVQFSGISERQMHFNPFELVSPSEAKLNRAQLQFSGAMEQIIGEPFTPRQRTLIRACLGIMLHRPGSTLVDLVRLLQDGQNTDLVQYGQTQLPNIIDRQFFRSSFSDPHYGVTKSALVSRLTDIARDPIIRGFTCHKSTFNLGTILDTGKVLVVRFDPHTQGRDTIRTIGQLLNAAILSHVLGRPASKRYPIHLFFDECQFFVSPTIAEILGESRKFGLYVTLATQRLESLDSALQDAVLGNVGTIWAGSSRNLTAEKIARETDVSAERIRGLSNLQFLQVASGQPTKHQRLRYLGNRYAMTPKQWRIVQKHQAERYYKRPEYNKPATDPKNSQSPWNPHFLDSNPPKS